MPIDPRTKRLLHRLGAQSITPVRGGDICSAHRVETGSLTLFVKSHPEPPPGMFVREAAGLRALRQHAPGDLGVPEVVQADDHALVLEWIEPGAWARSADERFGSELAGLHRASEDFFGGLGQDPVGYLGSLEVDLTPDDDWAAHYCRRRLEPLLRQGVRSGAIGPAAMSAFERAVRRADELCGPPEPPALLHGDLWAGNRLIDASGRNWLIDPSANWGRRECDLAMMDLFGGFSTGCLEAYQEAFPLPDGWRERVAWYQLPALCVHAILFGGGYGAQVVSVLSAYA